MFAPPPVYSPSGYSYEQHTNTNTTTNTTTNNNTQPEDIELTQTRAAPEIYKQSRRGWIFRTHLFSFILLLCVFILLIYVGGCIIFRLENYGNRGPERLFRAECEGVGGRVVVHKNRIAGWGLASIDCKHERAEGRMDFAEEMRTRTRRLDMHDGGVVELDSYGYSQRYRELVGPGLDEDYLS